MVCSGWKSESSEVDIAQVPLGRIISGSFVTITLGMHDPREPERARKGPKGPDEASLIYF